MRAVKAGKKSQYEKREKKKAKGYIYRRKREKCKQKKLKGKNAMM